MIKFEINEFPFALTNDQFSTIAGLIKLDPAQDYDIVEGDTDGIVWLWVHWEKSDPNLTPTRYWIEVDGNVSMVEDVDWDWQDGEEGVEAPTPRVELPALYPIRDGESAEAWTDRILGHAKEHGTNRQCSIGWHGECSDRAGETCRCLCHDDAARWYTVEGDAEDGTIVTRRTEQGKLHWPPTPGEPATIWAAWIIGLSADDASARAIKQQEARKP